MPPANRLPPTTPPNLCPQAALQSKRQDLRAAAVGGLRGLVAQGLGGRGYAESSADEEDTEQEVSGRAGGPLGRLLLPALVLEACLLLGGAPGA